MSFDEEGHIAGTAAVSGTLTVGGTATVRVHVPEGVTPAYGTYTIVTAAQISGFQGGWTIQVAGGAIRGSAAIRCDAEHGTLSLYIGPIGTVLFFR